MNTLLPTAEADVSSFTPADLNAFTKHDLMTFIERAFHYLYPQAEFVPSPHIQIIAAKLADCMNGKCKRLIVSLPPRSLKSHTVSVSFVAWLLGRDPTKQVICASYGQDLADKHARDTRNIMTSDFYKQIFPGTRLWQQKQSVNDFMTTKQGFRMSTSLGGTLTGRGGDILILDDILKPDDALSETRRKSANEWFDNTLLSRLNDKQDGVIIIVMQRLHQDDLVGHVLEKGEWEVLSFPAIAEEDERHVVEVLDGKYRFVFERRVGEVLDPRRDSLESLLEIRRIIGEYNFASQYQQNPISADGGIVKKIWLQYYDPAGPLPRFSYILQSYDTANKSGELNDYTVCTTWGVYDSRYYLLDVLRKRLNYPELKRTVRDQARKYPNPIILIEDRASGTQLIQDLKAEGMFGIKSFDPPPGTDKIMRLHAQSAEFEGGKALLPNSAPWLAEYVKELTGYPGSKFDDQIDSTTQALWYMKQFKARDIWARLGRGY